MEERMEMLKNWLVPFCKGAAVGGTNAVITVSYDQLIKSLPLWIRIPVDAAIAVGCHIVGMELLQLMEENADK